MSDGYRPAVGGLERVVETLSKALCAQGVPTVVATLSRPDAPAFEIRDGVQIHRLDGYTRHLRRFATDPGHYFHPTVPDPALVSRLNELISDFAPDIVHAHGWILNSCLSLQLPARTALVTTLHDYGLACAKKTLIPHDDLDVGCPGPSARRCVPCAGDYYGLAKGTALTLGLLHSKRRFHRVDMFLPISSTVSNACLSGIPATNICEIPSFVDDSIFTASRLTPRPDFLPDGDFVLFVGALGPHKGVDLLIEAHRRMRRDIPLVLIGSVRADTARWAHRGRRPVMVHTQIPHDQIMACYAAATVAVVPSRWQEPLGLTAVEAMASGTPVIATRIGALPEVVVDGHTGILVPPAEPDALCTALDQLVADSAWRARLGTAGRARARDFAASNVVPHVISVYQRLHTGAMAL